MEWTQPKDMEALFEFIDDFLVGDTPLLLFLPKFKIVKDDVTTYIASYGFSLMND